jgi:hypothetical protein
MEYTESLLQMLAEQWPLMDSALKSNSNKPRNKLDDADTRLSTLPGSYNVNMIKDLEIPVRGLMKSNLNRHALAQGQTVYSLA